MSNNRLVDLLEEQEKPSKDDLYFPPFLAEEDIELWLKELKLAGELVSCKQAIAYKDHPPRWELKTPEWVAHYEEVPGGWRLERAPAPRRPVAEAAAKYIREKLSEDSISSQILMTKEDYHDIREWGEENAEEG